MKSVRDVKDFRYITRRRDIATTINIVEVYGDAGDLPSLNAVQGVLRRTTNITTLVLTFSFEPALRILPTTQVFHNLTDLNVNAPHAAVAQFLTRHTLISSLVVGSCHASECALINSPLPFLQALTCPPGCVQALTAMAPPLTQLATAHGTAQDATISLLSRLNFAYIPTSSVITNLHISIDNKTTSLLQRISAATPALHVLRLTESPFWVGVRHLILIGTIDSLMKQIVSAIAMG
jgi:hypothetical protein